MNDLDVLDILQAVSERGTEWRLTYGSELRGSMHKQIKKGVEPDTYRWFWIKTEAKGLMPFLAEAAHRLNEDHPSDRASIDDMIDILKMAIVYLGKGGGSGQES
jgi:hypothetical protein